MINYGIPPRCTRNVKVKEAIDAPDPAETVDTVRCGIMDSEEMSLSDLCKQPAAVA